jgi:hypothetical protein
MSSWLTLAGPALLSGVLPTPLVSFRIQWCVILSPGMCPCVSGVLPAPLVSFKIQWCQVLSAGMCLMCQWHATGTTEKFKDLVTCHVLPAGMCSCVSDVLPVPLLRFRIQWRVMFFQLVFVRVSVACYRYHGKVSEFSDVSCSFIRCVFMCQWRAICTTVQFQNSVTCHIHSAGVSGVLTAPLVSFRI